MTPLRVREVETFLRPVRTRIPFRYGKAVVTDEPIAHVRLAAEAGGRTVTGASAAALPPLWFDKASPSHADTIRDLCRSIDEAAEVYRAAGAADAAALHRACEPEARRRCAAAGQNDLTAGFGVALVDAAVVDALCRHAGTTFHGALRTGLLGTGPELAALLPERPLPAVAVRHTVGMADPLVAADVTEPVGDGLPETLEEVVGTYGVGYFKVKVSGDAGASLDRLRRIASVLDRVRPDYRVTLDGNEQFATMEGALEFGRAAARLGPFWERTLWIEQPVDRATALDDAVAAPLRELSAIKPVIIDESDGTDGAADRALELGYAGVSAKNCKGVFRTLHSFALVARRGAILSSEDLMNTPVVPLQQDLCVAAALGIPHSERNGHHYIRGFEFLSPAEREAALREFPSLYEEKPSGPPGVRISGGAVDLREVNAFAFGVRSMPDWDRLVRP